MYKLLLVCVVFVVVALASFYPSLSQSTPNISFFITSAGSGNGANLGGLAGADAICQRLAAAVGAGSKLARLSEHERHGQSARDQCARSNRSRSMAER